MNNEANYEVLNAGGSFGDALTDAELGMILGGEADEHYSESDLRQDLGTIASTTGLGAALGGAAGAWFGLGVGLGMVAEERFDVGGHVVEFVSDLVPTVHNDNELPVVI